ncbi:substrate-binding periplasmic protein [Marinobacter halophilus]|uniref:Solute-binding protein family 3/N-terminal domain-containing protein n=1 Tax=Marinobacter halophilus TaxID=1323740 RepID=A0A2T1KEG7_9GAMM|nr:hypothetical protein [Marinobacter halophilus]PSF08438.1 hypothetical protein C7H08_07040 [Marinobacter halophilus]
MSVRALTVVVLLAVVCRAAAADEIVVSLYTFNSPPYQHANPSPDGPQVIGETVDTVRCAMDRAGASIHIRLMPQIRARYTLQRNLVDGYFAVDPSPEMDEAAVISHPVALEKWYWFYQGPRPEPATAKIGVIGGSNEEAWLIQNGFQPSISVRFAEQLPALLRRNRIDLALMDQRVMAALQQDWPSLGRSLESTFLRYAPLHLYLNNHFATKRPDFLSRFNRQLPDCMGAHMQLTQEEQQHLAIVANRLILDLMSEVDLAQAIHQRPGFDTFTDILTEDTIWQALAPQQPTPLASEILALPASENLRRWKADHAGMVTEILLTDHKGALVAMSQLSSDYWQGDEPKFQEVAAETAWGFERKADLWISPIRYDASTTQFQITVSVPIPLHEPNNGVEGVLVLGLAIEEALHNFDQSARERTTETAPF